MSTTAPDEGVGAGRHLLRIPPRERAQAEQSVRDHVARELHDRVAQGLTTMLVEIELFKRDQAGRASALGALEQLQANTREVLASLRDLVNDMRPERATTFTLAGALADLAARANARGSMTVSLSASGLAASGGPAALDVYRIVEEAVRNAERHGRASRVEVEVHAGREECRIRVADDGRGSRELGEAMNPGFGVRGMRERALLLAGDLVINSVEEVGTEVSVVFPTRMLGIVHPD